MAIKMKSQIDDKDLSDDIARILTDQLDALKNQLMQATYSSLLLNLDLSPNEWYNNQLGNKNALKKEIRGITKKGLNKVINSVNNGLDMLELEPKQVSNIRKTIKAEVNNLNSLVLGNYDTILTGTMLTATKVFKSGVTDSLYEIIQKKITETNDYGVRYYKNGRTVRWENYMEMKVRTDIQNDIAKNMVKAGLENGVVFYICSYHGDCAPDHKDYQGKIYYDKNWKSNIQDIDFRSIIQEYIDKQSMMSIQKVMKEPIYLTSRPNCRHYFQYISIDEVLNIKNDSDLNKKREELNLNSKGKYRPEKYEALKEQRYNERKIRKIKSEIEVQEKLINNLPTDATIGITNQQQHKLLLLKKNLKSAQKGQRELIKSNSSVLDRNYNREAYNRMISNMGVKPLKSKELDGTIINKYKTSIEKIKNVIPIQKQYREIIDNRFKDGTYKDAIADIQNRHIEGTQAYNECISKGIPKSILKVKPESLSKYIGTGTLEIRKDGQAIETIIVKKIIGLYVSDRLDAPIETNVFEVRFSKHGYHFIPVHPKKGNG